MSSSFQVNYQQLPEVYNTIETAKGVFVVIAPNNEATVNALIEVGRKRKWPFQEIYPSTIKSKKTRYN